MESSDKHSSEETVNVRLSPEPPDDGLIMYAHYWGYRQGIKDFAHLLNLAVLVCILAYACVRRMKG